MADKQEDIIYKLTKEDVDDVAKQIGLSNLTDEHYRMARKYFESFCDGPARIRGLTPFPTDCTTLKRNFGASIRILTRKNNLRMMEPHASPLLKCL